MPPRAVWFLGTVAALVTAGWPAAPRANEVQESDAPVVSIAPPPERLLVGERISFHGRWFGIPVGSGWIEVKALTSLHGRPVYQIEAQGHSNEFLSTFYPIRDVIHSYLDATTLQPLQFEKDQREGHYRAKEIVTFDYERLIASYRSLLNNSTKEVPIPPGVQDIVSAFYWLRRQPIDPTHPISLDIYSDEKVYRTQIKPLKTVMLELLWRGTFPCLMIEPEASFKGILVRRGRIWVYITVDERRLPLFLKVSTPWGPMTGVIDPESLQAPRLVGKPGQAS